MRPWTRPKKSGSTPTGAHCTPARQSAQPIAHVRAQRNKCSGAGGYGRQRRGEGNVQVADVAARRVLCQIEGKTRQATRGQTVGMVTDARGCACGNESRAPDDCAVVEREPDWTGGRVYKLRHSTRWKET